MHRDPKDDKRSTAERRRLNEVGRIKSLLVVAKLTLTDIDRAYGLPTGTAGNAVHEPHLAGERAIAAALKTRPHLLWRSRYFSNGTRKVPQPAENYRMGRRAVAASQEAA